MKEERTTLVRGPMAIDLSKDDTFDVIAEYTRPARFVENGVTVTRDAPSDPELLEFPGIGSLEAINTDGLRTLEPQLANTGVRTWCGDNGGSCPNRSCRWVCHLENTRQRIAAHPRLIFR